MEYYALRAAEILLDSMWIPMRNARWMLWNTLLALIPLYLAARLFRRPGLSFARPLWWVGVATFLAFLPNALYVLTDLIHLSRDVPASTTPWRMAFVVLPTYLAFCAVGWGSYVVSLIWLSRSLSMRGWRHRTILAVELAIHLACAIGVYLGRFIRFNSWDLVTRPHHVADTTVDVLARVSPLGTIAVFFAATCLLYWPSKHVVIAVVAYVRSGGHRRASALSEQYM